MKSFCTAMGLLAFAAMANAADKPVVYDHITKDGASIDEAVNAALAPKYTIQPVEDSPAYVDVKAAGGDVPRQAKTPSGEFLKGYILVAYVVTADGRAADPVVLKTTDARLNPTVLTAMQTWRFTPATLNGTAIATTAAQEFNFKSAPTGFETANVVLYQTNDVLEKRLPDVHPFADYVKKLQALLTDHFAGESTPETFHTVVGVRPGKIVQVWFVSTKRPDNAPELEDLRKKLEAVDPIEVKDGPVAFAISGKIAGGDASTPPQDGKNFQPPIPQQWEDNVKDLKKPLLFDDYLNKAWPEK